MWKKYKKNGDDTLVRSALVTVMTIGILYVIFLAIFWIFVGVVIVAILSLIHFLNKQLKWYDTRYYSAPLLSFWLTTILIVFLWSEILFDVGKIDTTVLAWAKEWSTYVSTEYVKWDDTSGSISVSKPRMVTSIAEAADSDDTSIAESNNEKQKGSSAYLWIIAVFAALYFYYSKREKWI